MGLKRNTGIALITVLFFLAILSSCWVVFSYYTIYEEGFIQDEIRSDQALYLAESGAQQALCFLGLDKMPTLLPDEERDWDWRNWEADYRHSGGVPSNPAGTAYTWTGDLGQGNATYTVAIRNDGQIGNVVRSTGSVINPDGENSTTRTIEIEIGSPFDFALFSNNDLELSGNVTVSGPDSGGNVYARNSITDISSLTADKITGGFQDSTTGYSYFPRESALPPIAWEANLCPTAINGQFIVNCDFLNVGDVSKWARVRNNTRNVVEDIVSLDTGTNTITIADSVTWNTTDDIVIEGSEYEDFWLTLVSEESSHFPTSPSEYDDNYGCNNFVATVNGYPACNTLIYDPPGFVPGESCLQAGDVLYNTTKGGSAIISAINTSNHRLDLTTPVSPQGVACPGTASWGNGDTIEADGSKEIDFKPSAGTAWRTGQGTQAFPIPASTSTYFQSLTTVTFYGDTTFEDTIRIDANAVFGRHLGNQSYGSTKINGGILVNGNAYFFNQTAINGNLFVTGDVYMWDYATYKDDASNDDNDNDMGVNESSSGKHGITIGPDGGVYVNGSFTIYKGIQDGGFGTEGYCYIGSYTEITGPTGQRFRIDNTVDPNKALYIRNGHLRVTGSLDGGGVIIARDTITITKNLFASSSADPLFVIAGNDLHVNGTVGGPFYGMLFARDQLNIDDVVSITGGLMVAGDINPLAAGSSITYRDFKSDGTLFNLGFRRDADYVRPLVWRDVGGE